MTSVLERKISYCRDHLAVQARVAPGLSEYRAYISWHIAEPLVWTTKEKFLQKQITREELISRMEEVARHLLIVIQIWGPFRRRSTEWMIAEKARTLLGNVDEKYLHKDLISQAEDVLQRRALKSYRSLDF